MKGMSMACTLRAGAAHGFYTPSGREPNALKTYVIAVKSKSQIHRCFYA